MPIARPVTVMRLVMLCIALAASGAGVAAQVLHGRVVGISDGDTITIVDAAKRSHRVRLGAIDAPERTQPYSVQSRQALAARVFHRDVAVLWSKLDRYDRIVGKVVIDGMDVNLAQVADGMAWHYRQYESEQSREDARAYQAAEDQARKRRLGLWADANPESPWKFRRE
jgi:endonuclease YncB( thermonuclease family)